MIKGDFESEELSPSARLYIFKLRDCHAQNELSSDLRYLTRGASGYSSLLGNLSVYMCVCISGQAESTPSVQNQYTWASYETLEKTIILSFVEKASVKSKGLQKL